MCGLRCLHRAVSFQCHCKTDVYKRQELGYDGVVMTDDLVMDAIRAYTDNGTAAVAAVQAGNDLLCCTDFTEQIPAVIEAVNDGTISESRINESVLRILQAKINLGIIS